MSGPSARRALRVLGLLLVGLVVQTTFGADLRAHTFAPDIMLLLAVMAGFSGGADAGTVIGFGSGLLSDLTLQGTPFGLSALAFCLVGFAVGWTRDNLLRTRLAIAPLVAAGGTLFGVFVFVAIGYVLGQSQLVTPGKRWLVVLAVVEAAWSVVFSLPVAWLFELALRGPQLPVSALGEVTSAAACDTASRRRVPAPRARRRRRARAKVR